MKKEIGKKLIGAVKKIDNILGEIHEIAENIDDLDQKKRIRRAIANLVCDTHEKITLEVATEYPDLHPDRATG